MNVNTTSNSPLTRRGFLKASAVVTAVGAFTSSIGPVFAAGSDKIRVGLIGYGSRGTGAAMNCVLSTPGVEIVALDDVFQDRFDASLKQLKDNNQGKEWSCSRDWKNANQVKATKESELDLTPKEIRERGCQLGPAPTVLPPAKGNEELT